MTTDVTTELLTFRTCCDCHREAERPLLTYEEAGDLLRVCPRTIRNWCDDGRLERAMLSHQVQRVTTESVQRLIQEGLAAAKAQDMAREEWDREHS